tara:strand:+ start:3654 stop:4070 length:417 start_codon:yes stop_codon:yes gene_type:complete
MEIREIKTTDYLEYKRIISQLSKTKFNEEDFKIFFNLLNKNHKIFVIESCNKLLGCGTILIEPKLIHNMSYVGHIEDIVIDNRYRNNSLGYKIISFLIEYCSKVGCYKVILDCKEELVNFYKKNGFEENNVGMSIYFN